MLLYSLHLIYLQKPWAYTYPPPPHCHALIPPHTLLAFTCNVNNCHHRHSFLFHCPTYPCNTNLTSTLYTHYNTWMLSPHLIHYQLCMYCRFSLYNHVDRVSDQVRNINVFIFGCLLSFPADDVQPGRILKRLCLMEECLLYILKTGESGVFMIVSSRIHNI